MTAESQALADILRDEFRADIIHSDNDAEQIAGNFLELLETLREVKARNEARNV